jgi:ribonucleoside-diphosphate reductase alpha chain
MVQAIAQEYIDSSISKTVNAPNGHTVDDVKKLYLMAYESGLKGVTYMRDGSREGVLSRVEEKKEEKPQEVSRPTSPRPYMVEGVTYKTETPVGDTYITLNHDENKEPFEVFITIGKSGSDVAAMADALGRMISLNLRLAGNLPPRDRIRQVVAQLSGIGGARSVGFGENRVRSLPDAVAKVLARHFEFKINGVVEDKKPILVSPGPSITNGNGITQKLTPVVTSQKKEESIVMLQQLPLKEGMGLEKTETHLFDICPECGAGAFAYEEGCRKCYACGHSEC